MKPAAAEIQAHAWPRACCPFEQPPPPDEPAIRLISRQRLVFCESHQKQLSGFVTVRHFARRYGFPAAAAVGVLFGAVRAQDVRPLCESWAVWADARLGSIAAAWKAALP